MHSSKLETNSRYDLPLESRRVQTEPVSELLAKSFQK
jgi:hypothetical protein